jgi:regulator of extracellular matrix RemA (YlzA/DUF370 family)
MTTVFEALMISIGFGNFINESKVTALVKPEAAPIKRLVQSAKDGGTCVDATSGRKCRTVIVTDDGRIILSALLSDTISNRVNKGGIEL